MRRDLFFAAAGLLAAISVLFLVITEHSAKKDVHSVDIWLYLVISVFFCLVVVCRDFSRSLSPK